MRRASVLGFAFLAFVPPLTALSGPRPGKGTPPAKSIQVDFEGDLIEGESVRPRMVVMVNAARPGRKRAANEGEADRAIRELEGKGAA